jgi:hypothetical protein
VGKGSQGAAARWESFKDILFDFDRSNVRTDERDTINQIVQFMKEHPTFEVGLEGYADPRGTDAYNQALSERRVKAIRDALVASGAVKDGIRIGAEGEKHRNCSEDTEGCFQKNRRVEVFVRARCACGSAVTGANAMMRTLIIGVATAGLLASVAGCSTSTGAPRWGYVGPDNTPGWKGQNFYAYQNGYVALNYTNDDE